MVALTLHGSATLRRLSQEPGWGGGAPPSGITFGRVPPLPVTLRLTQGIASGPSSFSNHKSAGCVPFPCGYTVCLMYLLFEECWEGGSRLADCSSSRSPLRCKHLGCSDRSIEVVCRCNRRRLLAP